MLLHHLPYCILEKKKRKDDALREQLDFFSVVMSNFLRCEIWRQICQVIVMH